MVCFCGSLVIDIKSNSGEVSGLLGLGSPICLLILLLLLLFLVLHGSLLYDCCVARLLLLLHLHAELLLCVLLVVGKGAGLRGRGCCHEGAH